MEVCVSSVNLQQLGQSSSEIMAQNPGVKPLHSSTKLHAQQTGKKLNEKRGSLHRELRMKSNSILSTAKLYSEQSSVNEKWPPWIRKSNDLISDVSHISNHLYSARLKQ